MTDTLKSTEDISRLPFLKILPPVVIGIVGANAFHIPLWIYVAMTAVSFAAAIIFFSRRAASPLTALTILLFAATMTAVTATREVMPHGERMIMTMNITDTPQSSDRWIKATARVDKYRPFNASEEHPVWFRSGELVVARLDTAYHVGIGDRLIVSGYAGALGTNDYQGYVNLMRRRGYSATVWIDSRQECIVLPEKHHTPRYYAALLRSAASERLLRLDIPRRDMNVAAAMTIGERSAMDRETKESYSATGTSHLLAVSGLHVGIVAMLINLLLWLLPAFRGGHIVKNTAAIIVIWLYAFMTGLSPSVVRAAIMFTGAQAALASSRSSARLNILLATAAIMLLICPNYLYDISFQLSFAAVAGIFMFYEPLYGLVKSRYGLLNAFWTVFMVGLAATLATTPLVSYYFGRIPIIGLIINPAVILTANAVVLLSILWIIMPVAALNGIFSAAIGFCAKMQNGIIAVGADKAWASVPIRLEAWHVISIYITAVAAYCIIRRLRASRPQKEDEAYLTIKRQFDDE